MWTTSFFSTGNGNSANPRRYLQLDHTTEAKMAPEQISQKSGDN